MVTKDLEARLATLPDRSIVYYLVVYQDGAGEQFAPMTYTDRISAAARAPTYSWSDALIDHGIVGGSLLDRPSMMSAVGDVAVRVLKGEPAESIPVASPNLNRRHVDWRQLRRWGISEARVPAGTQIHFRQPTVWDTYKAYIVGTVAIVLLQTALISGLLVQRARRRHAEEVARGSQAALRTSYDRIHDLGGRLLTAQDTERARIARELHDDVSQQIALLTIDLELLAGAAEGESEPLAHESVSRAHAIARSVRDLSHSLHPTKLRLIGLVASLQSLEREVARSGLAVTFTHENVPSDLPPDLTLCLFRIVQEALQNALRYSNARKVLVHLTGGPDGLSLTIADDGVGFDVDAGYGKGLGLISMRERLDAVGGTLDIRSAPGAGTRLDVGAPLAARHAASEERADSA
jgi:signal transduction histidine kinase